jgi:hypothetical protein
MHRLLSPLWDRVLEYTRSHYIWDQRWTTRPALWRRRVSRVGKSKNALKFINLFVIKRDAAEALVKYNALICRMVGSTKCG